MPWLLGAVMVVLAAGCLMCVPGLLRGPAVATWLMVAVMAGGMLVLHAGAMTLRDIGTTPVASGGHQHPAHTHGATNVGSPVASHVRVHLAGEGWDLMHVASLVAGAELVLATGMARAARRSRREASWTTGRFDRQAHPATHAS
jgi:hypothetical protein